jgi:hypothetical protein
MSEELGDAISVWHVKIIKKNYFICDDLFFWVVTKWRNCWALLLWLTKGVESLLLLLLLISISCPPQ